MSSNLVSSRVYFYSRNKETKLQESVLLITRPRPFSANLNIGNFTWKFRSNRLNRKRQFPEIPMGNSEVFAFLTWRRANVGISLSWHGCLEITSCWLQTCKPEIKFTTFLGWTRDFSHAGKLRGTLGLHYRLVMQPFFLTAEFSWVCSRNVIKFSNSKLRSH